MPPTTWITKTEDEIDSEDVALLEQADAFFASLEAGEVDPAAYVDPRELAARLQPPKP